MPVREGLEGAQLLLELISKPVKEDARLALSACILRFGSQPELILAAERHGEVASVAINDHSDWVYSLAPAQNWILGRVRPPEVRKGRLSFEALVAAFPDAKTPQDEHYTVRLHNYAEAEKFCSVVLSHRS